MTQPTIAIIPETEVTTEKKHFHFKPVFQIFMLVMSIVFYTSVFHEFQNSLPTPVLIKRSPVASTIEQSLALLDAPEKTKQNMIAAINNAAHLTGIDPQLLVALIYTESTFKIDAVSYKGYKGLMQTPWASMKWVDVDILIGARILKEKLALSNNDIITALSLYKGGNNPLARKYAHETIKVYKMLKTSVEV